MFDYEKLVSSLYSTKYKDFQENLANSWYNEIKEGFKNKEKEEEIVKRVVDISKNQSVNNVLVGAEFIHGSRSMVEFKYQGDSTKRELGDMIIVTLVSSGNKRIAQRICIIQNKVGKQRKNYSSWNIDLPQLFLLANTPKITGISGLIPKGQTVFLSNHTGCIGAYGLFHQLNEMVFCSAPLLDACMTGKKSVSTADFKNIASLKMKYKTFCNNCIDLFSGFDAYYQYLIKRRLLHGIPVEDIPIVGNTIYTKNILEFIRKWTHANIGEYTYCFGKPVNYYLDRLAFDVLKRIGLARNIEYDGGENYLENELSESSMGLIGIQIDIS